MCVCTVPCKTIRHTEKMLQCEDAFKNNDKGFYFKTKPKKNKFKSIFGATSLCLQNSINLLIGTHVRFLRYEAGRLF